jgi:GNAT superfamily N-acetyltransferase
VETLDRMLATMRATFAGLGRGQAHWADRDGVGTLVTPQVPNRSIVNCVIYERRADVQTAYQWLEERFSAVEAWTVWVPESDHHTAAFLASRGHRLDADPAMMVLDLASFSPAVPIPDWRRASVEELAAINEAAYPWRDGSIERALLGGASGSNGFRLYIAEDAAVVGVNDVDGDAGVFFVATLPAARGRGLASGLLAAAMLEARERGCDVSTLQATKLGEPVYARVGYQRFGAIEMWEKCRA